MSKRTHTSSWRLLITFLPLVGVAALALIAIQGEPEVFLSRKVHFVLLPATLVAWLVAWRLVHLLSGTPVIAVAQAQPGYVALRGRAQAMPNRPPLTTPSGTPCVWYHYGHTSGTGHTRSYSSNDTVQPFLLADDSGECIVLPDGAEINGLHDDTGGVGRVKFIAPGDKLYVTGEFRPLSADTLQQQDVAPEPVSVSVTLDADDANETPAQWRARGEQKLKEAIAAKGAAAAIRPSPLALPVVCAPRFKPFMITANKDGSSQESTYRLLANANLVLLLASGAMLAYLLWAGR